MVQVGGWQKKPFFIKEKVKMDPVGVPSAKNYLRQPVHQIQAEVVRFLTVVCLTKSLNHNYRGIGVLSEVPA